MSIRHLSEALVAGLLLASAAASQTSSGCTAHPLSRVVAEFHVRDVGVLQALLQLGRENAIIDIVFLHGGFDLFGAGISGNDIFKIFC